MVNYDFGEQKTVYNSKLGKDVEVWQSPNYKQAKQKAIEIIESEQYKGVITPANFWILQNTTKSGKMAYTGLIISHNGCLLINDKLPEDKKFKPECITVDKNGYNDSLVFTYCCAEQGIYEVGEVNPKNCKIDYLYAIGLKRVIDRVILKNSKLAYSGIYSEVESEEFKEPERTEEPKAKEPTTKPTTKPTPDKVSVRSQLVEFCKNNKIDIKPICKQYGLNNNSPVEDFEKALKYSQFLAKKNALNK